MLASLIAFDATAVQALSKLHKGDPISVAGVGKLTQWAGRDGVEKRGLGVTVQAVLTIYQARKRKREAAEGSATRRNCSEVIASGSRQARHRAWRLIHPFRSGGPVH